MLITMKKWKLLTVTCVLAGSPAYAFASFAGSSTFATCQYREALETDGEVGPDPWHTGKEVASGTLPFVANTLNTMDGELERTQLLHTRVDNTDISVMIYPDREKWAGSIVNTEDLSGSGSLSQGLSFESTIGSGKRVDKAHVLSIDVRCQKIE